MADTQRFGGPKSIPLGELSKGMIRNVPTNRIPAGGFFDLDGFVSTDRGVRRASAVEDYVVGFTVSEHMVAVEAITDPAAAGLRRILVSDDWVYDISTSGFTRVDRVYNAGTVTISSGSVNVQGNSTAFLTNLIKAGDEIIVEPGTGSEETRTIATVVAESGAAAITVTVAFASAHTTKAYKINRKVGVTNPYLVDIVRLEDRILIHSRANEPWALTFSSPTVAEAITAYPSTGKFKAACGCFWNERHFVGNLMDGSDGERIYRIRWSDAGDITDFSDPEAFLDLNYTASPLLRLVPLGQMLIALFQDAIFIGRPTNIPGLPVAFPEKPNTGGIGLVGQRALADHLEGIFFLGQDNVYKLSNAGFGGIADAVFSVMCPSVMPRWRSMMVTDLLERRILIGVQGSTDVMETLWSFDMRKGGWSRRSINSYMLAAVWMDAVESWDTLVSDWDAYERDWSSFLSSNPSRWVLIERDGGLHKIGSGSGETDNDGSPITAVIETGDFDYGLPDDNKTAHRIGLTISESFFRSSPITFQVFVSPNRGVTWIPKGDLTIRVGMTEGYLNFRAKSSVLRHRLVSSSQVPSYTVEEIVHRAKAGGRELSLGKQSDV